MASGSSARHDRAMTGRSETQTTAEAMEAAAMPRCAELRADGRNHAVPMPAAVTRATAGKSAAEWAYQRVIFYLKAFEEDLDAGTEVAMAFSGGAAGVLRIAGVGFHAPDLVTFTGAGEDGQRMQQIVHVSQLNLILRALPRPVDAPEPERIGFRLARALEEEAATSRPAGDGPTAA